MRLSLSTVLVISAVGAAVYLLLRSVHPQQSDPDDEAAEIIARYRPAIDRALQPHGELVG